MYYISANKQTNKEMKTNLTLTDTRKALKPGGGVLVYFPDFTKHELNGAAFRHTDCKTKLTVFEASDNNLSRSAGYWFETIRITPDMFGVESVRVRIDYNGYDEKEFFLGK